MLAFLRGCAIGAGLVFAAAAQAQQDPRSEAPDIVVTGNEGLDRQVRDFVGALAKAPGQGQLSRFEWAVCPLSVGLSPAQNQAVASRIRRVAQGVGMKVADAGCAPNILVAAVADKQAFLRGLVQRQPGLFADMAPSRVRRLAREPGPVAAWQLKGLRRADGYDLVKQNSSDIYVNQAAGSGSHIQETARPHFTAAVVVMELDAVQGLTTTQLADYAAMRAFARTDPSRLPASTPSILKAVGAPVGTAVPITMTEWDLGFLRALYSSADNLKAAFRRTEMRRILADELTTSSEGKDRVQ